MSEGPSEELLRQTGRFLVDGTAGQRKKLRLLRRLLHFPADPRVREVLLSAAIVEKNENLLASILLGLGRARDPALADRLVLFLQHPSAKVVAAALRAIGCCDVREGPARILPFLNSRTPRVRTAAVLALLTISPREAQSAIQSLAASSHADVRRSAVRCLTVCPPAMVAQIALAMLRTEQDGSLAMELETVLGRLADDDGIRQVITARQEVLVATDEGGDRFACHLDNALRHAADRRQISSADLPSSLGVTGPVPPAAQDGTGVSPVPIHTTGRGPQARAGGGGAGTDSQAHAVAPGLVLAAKLLLLSGLVGGSYLLVHVGTRYSQASRHVAPIVRPGGAVPTRTQLGNVGETVLIEGKVLRRFERRHSVVLQLDSGLLVWMHWDTTIPSGMALGDRIAQMGAIEAEASRGAIYVRGVVPPADREAR